jgi:hypothetical protein
MVLFITTFSTKWTFHQGIESAGVCETCVDAHVEEQWKDSRDPLQSTSDLVKGEHGAVRIAFFDA